MCRFLYYDMMLVFQSDSIRNITLDSEIRQVNQNRIRKNNIHHIRSWKTTKILHLKRPKFFPVLDSFVIKFLLESNDSNVDIGLIAMDKIRQIIQEQKIEFQNLVDKTRDLPILLTPIRMFDILCWTTEKWDIRGNHKAPYGTAHKSLLTNMKKDNKTKENQNNRIIKFQSSSATSIINNFMSELIERAWYGIKGEKPLATIAALKFLHDNEIFQIELLNLIEGNYSSNVRRIFINLAKKSKKIKDPSSSWSVITGSNRELQNAIKQFGYGDVNKAFSELTKKEIETLLNNYLRRL